ncbi:protein kinase domain-containing protein [Hahella sp. NBU794]|uniref:protein kinase domain-containing protein n=1 Tax=Hahella sp. NBU794 TaxID=3422590 RepID=UPI003D6E57AB
MTEDSRPSQDSLDEVVDPTQPQQDCEPTVVAPGMEPTQLAQARSVEEDAAQEDEPTEPQLRTEPQERTEPQPEAAPETKVVPQPATAVSSNTSRRTDNTATGKASTWGVIPPAILQNYDLVEWLTTIGAEATVGIVTRHDNGEDCILKLYNPNMRPKDEVVRYLLGNQGKHHIVNLIEAQFCMSTHRFFEVMEFVQAGTLKTYLKSLSGPMSLTMVHKLLAQLHDALTRLHEHAIVHRDLKPDNILLRTTSPLDICLVDFGISSMMNTESNRTTISRTERYAAPEASTGLKSAALDWWSVGMIIMECLRGKGVFEQIDHETVVDYKILHDIDVSGVADVRWRLLCAGLLTRNNELRWGTEQIGRWLAGDNDIPVYRDLEPVKARRVSARGKVPEGAFRIGLHDCMTLEEVGKALQSEWDVNPLVDKVLAKQLENWFSSQDNLEAAQRVRHFAQESSDPNLRLFKFISYLNPSLKAKFKELELTREGLQAFLGQGAKNLTRSNLETLTGVYRHNLLEQAGKTQRDVTLRQYAHNWQREVIAYLTSLKGLRQQSGTETLMPRVEANPLLNIPLKFAEMGSFTQPGAFEKMPGMAFMAHVLEAILKHQSPAEIMAQVSIERFREASQVKWFGRIYRAEPTSIAEARFILDLLPMAEAQLADEREEKRRYKRALIERVIFGSLWAAMSTGFILFTLRNHASYLQAEKGLVFGLMFSVLLGCIPFRPKYLLLHGLSLSALVCGLALVEGSPVDLSSVGDMLSSIKRLGTNLAGPMQYLITLALGGFVAGIGIRQVFAKAPDGRFGQRLARVAGLGSAGGILAVIVLIPSPIATITGLGGPAPANGTVTQDLSPSLSLFLYQHYSSWVKAESNTFTLQKRLKVNEDLRERFGSRYEQDVQKTRAQLNVAQDQAAQSLGEYKTALANACDQNLSAEKFTRHLKDNGVTTANLSDQPVTRLLLDHLGQCISTAEAGDDELKDQLNAILN